MRFQLPVESDNVPNNAVGIYRFLLRFPTDYELGLQEKNSDVQSARVQLLETLLTMEQVRLGLPLAGVLATENVSKHLRNSMKINATHVSDLSKWFNNAIPLAGCDDKKLRAASEVLRRSLDASIAIYIGMTGKQSFSTRLRQHLAGGSNLLPQMRGFKLSISQLWYECIEIESPDKDLINRLEDLAQATLKPPFSKA